MKKWNRCRITTQYREEMMYRSDVSVSKFDPSPFHGSLSLSHSLLVPRVLVHGRGSLINAKIMRKEDIMVDACEWWCIA